MNVYTLLLTVSSVKQGLYDSVFLPQANEYWTAIRTDAQYYMDMSNLMFDRSVAELVNKLL